MKNIFYHITKKTLKQNRTRTWLTIIGVLLSTAMITAVATFGEVSGNFLLITRFSKMVTGMFPSLI